MGLSNKQKQARYRERKRWLEREVERLQSEVERLKSNIYLSEPISAIQRFLAVAAKHTPSDVTVKYHNGRGGRAVVEERKIFVPRPSNRDRLHVYLHEVAHIVCKHNRKKPLHVEEMEAEQWATRVMREEGIPVPLEALEFGKRYVQGKIQTAEWRGEPIDPAARRFVGRPRSRW
jgi:hypothetical protein